MQLNGQAVRDHREVAGLTQAELGETVGRDQVTISAIETGRLGTRRAPIDLIRALAAALGCRPSELVVDPPAVLLARESAGAEAAVS
jgi:transcriptional regulator with XRE-family HTH domain